MYEALLGLLLLFPQLVDKTDQLESADPAAQQDLSHERRGDIYMARKMYREAVDEYRRALDEQPSSARLYNKIGISFHHQLRFDEAKKHYERASDLDEKFAQAINNLGTIYYAEGRYRRAQKTYQKALKITPLSASIYSNLGTAFFARNKYEKATEAYLQALEIDPKVFENKSETGTLLQERSVADRAKYHFFLAKAYAEAEMYDRALIYLRRSMEEGYADRGRVLGEKAFEPMVEQMVELQQLIGIEISQSGEPQG